MSQLTLKKYIIYIAVLLLLNGCGEVERVGDRFDGGDSGNSSEGSTSSSAVKTGSKITISIGSETVGAGSETVGAGPETVEAGPETVEAGPETVEAGPETVEAGPETVEAGPETVEAGPETVGTALVSWISPTENTDNSALTDLAGFKIYYGQFPGEYGNTITVNNPGLSSVLVENLGTADWFFVVTAFNSSGIESAYSAEVHKQIN